MKYAHVFNPGIWGNKIKTANRLIVSPLNLNYATSDGRVTQRHVDYWRERTKGGWGIAVFECTAISVNGKDIVNAPCLWDDSYIPWMKKIVDVCHAENLPMTIQLSHSGRQTTYRDRTQGHIQLAPSPVQQFREGDPLAWKYETPRALTVREIHQIRDDFIECAVRAQKAGFDGVQLHVGHGYTLNCFLSRAVNKREDEYGGDLESRARLHREILEGIRLRLGDYPVEMRLSGKEYYYDVDGPITHDFVGAAREDQREQGMSLKETVEAALLMAKYGVDHIDVSGGSYGAAWWMLPPMEIPEAAHMESGVAVKKALMEAGYDKVTVSFCGRINSIELCEKILRDTPVDYLSIGRQSLCDPRFPRKARSGEEHLIRQCLYCNEGCTDRVLSNQDVECLYNVQLGKEGLEEYQIRRAAAPRKVLIVGGGPGGCQAAEVAAKRGHKVILCEKTNRLGGQIAISMYGGWKYLIKYYENVLKHLGVDIRFNTTVTPEYVEQLKPDVVVVATGGTPVKMNVKGRDLPNVVTYFDVLSGKVKPGKRVVVIGWFCGAGETVEFLRDRDVTLVSSQPESAFLQDLEFTRRCVRMLTLFNKRKPPLTMYYDATVKEITLKGPLVASGGKEQTIPCDTVVMAVGIRSDRELADALKTRVPEFYVVGDCLLPRKLKDSVHEGFRVGNMI